MDNRYQENSWGDVAACEGTVKGGLYEEATIKPRLVGGTSLAKSWSWSLQTEGAAVARPWGG